jgi:hypothetical protein
MGITGCWLPLESTPATTTIRGSAAYMIAAAGSVYKGPGMLITIQYCVV